MDISFTKDWADFNHPNKVDPKVNQLYIGWEEDGEWTNYTVRVMQPGKYRIITVYSNYDNHSELWLNGVKAAQLKLPEDTGSPHKWTQATVGEITFPTAGLNLLTLHYNKGPNLAYFDFLLEEPIRAHSPRGPLGSAKWKIPASTQFSHQRRPPSTALKSREWEHRFPFGGTKLGFWQV